MDTLLSTHLDRWPLRRGKVRDIYDLGDRLLLVATDRISAFDWVLPTGIPDKGRILTALSVWWFNQLDVPNHLLSADLAELADQLPPDALAPLTGRSLIVRKTQVIPFECVVRGYLAGSGWTEYQKTGALCGQPLPAGLRNADRLPEPLFTPATKATDGHDENISLDRLTAALGRDRAAELQRRSLELYAKASAIAGRAGLILADTKFEWGLVPGTDALLLIDEVLTPDSSRYWDAASYRPGGPQPSFDKQFVRDWLDGSGWDKASPPPALPPEIVDRTRAKYVECFERLTQSPFPTA
ncbi:MAG: phosphoribosylaminoimidazole-succinocarboxamide synthase [Isosphaeraceae bacterium]|nr:MAG: phosphoribosylaminoimidazole-succinocarboxamide synthase [Isosphaeraceae bacterium]